MTSPANGDPDDQLAARAEALDEALAAGQEPPVPVPDAEINETFSALLAAHASLRMLERVWPRAEGRTTPDETTRVEAIPTCFGRFRMIRELGRGGFGVVFLAIDPELDRPVALKLPLAEALLKEEVRGRFVREARAAAALDHPNIVPLYEAGEIDSICYLVSAFCDGPTLAAWLRDQKSAICPLLAARLVAEMADAVRHSHERGVLHRDLKPSNVIMDIGRATWSAAAEARPRENDASNLRGTTNPARVGGAGAEQSDSPGARENPIPRISDFGLARLMDQPGEELTASFAAMGSAAYMAPEQAEGGKVGPAADIYSLGAILYVLLCNRPPHRGVNEFDTLRRVVTDAPIPPRARRSDVPRDLEAICLKCLEKDPARRYSSARELARDLERFLERRPTVARPPTAPARAFRWLRRRPAGLVFAIVAITFSLALAGTILRTGNRPETVRLSDRSIVATVAPPDDGARDPKQQSDRILYVAEMRLADRYLRDNQAAQAVEILDRRRPAAGNGDLREFIWHHLRMKCDASRRTLSGHRGAVYHVEFSPQGDRLASAAKDGTVFIWDTSSWTVICSLPPQNTELNIATFSPDGLTLATSGDDGIVRLWTVATGHLLYTLAAHPGAEGSARFTPDGKTLITGSSTGMVKLWDAATGQELDHFKFEGKRLFSMVLSPDGKILAGGGEHRIQLRNLKTHELLATLSGHSGAVLDVAFSHDGRRLISAGEGDRSLRLHEVTSGRHLRTFAGHRAGVRSVKFMPDDRSIVSCGNDLTVRTWDLASGEPLSVGLGHSDQIWGMAVSPDGQTIASGSADRTVKLWDSRLARDHCKLPIPQPASFGFTPTGQTLITLEVSPWSIARWNAGNNLLLDRNPIRMTSGHLSSTFSSDGQRLAVATTDGSVTIWNVETRLSDGRLDGVYKNISLMLFSYDAKYLLVHDAERGFTVWGSGTRRQVIFPWSDSPTAIFTPAGEIIAVPLTGYFVVWNPINGRSQWRNAGSGGTSHATISQDGHVLAGVDLSTNRISLWSADRFEPKNPLYENSHHYGRLALSPDGKILAAAGRDRTLKLWDVTTGEEVITLDGVGDRLTVPRFSPDGATLAAQSDHGEGKNAESQIHLWHAPRREIETIGQNLRRDRKRVREQLSHPGDRWQARSH